MNPAPDTVLDAERVVNAPVPAVVEPMLKPSIAPVAAEVIVMVFVGADEIVVELFRVTVPEFSVSVSVEASPSVASPLTPKVVNVAAAGVVVPTLTPFSAETVEPRACAVEPNVMLLLVRLVLAILDNVLVDPLMVLLVSVCAPVRVATVESMATVTPALPLKLVPERPVPIVSVLGVLAVMVAVPPDAIVVPLTVIAGTVGYDSAVQLANKVGVVPVIT